MAMAYVSFHTEIGLPQGGYISSGQNPCNGVPVGVLAMVAVSSCLEKFIPRGIHIIKRRILMMFCLILLFNFVVQPNKPFRQIP